MPERSVVTPDSGVEQRVTSPASGAQLETMKREPIRPKATVDICGRETALEKSEHEAEDQRSPENIEEDEHVEEDEWQHDKTPPKSEANSVHPSRNQQRPPGN